MERRGTHKIVFRGARTGVPYGVPVMFMQVLENVSLAELTTLRLGGVARFYVSVYSIADLREAMAFAKEKRLPVWVLGGGSNTLFTEEGWPGLVIHIAIAGTEYKEDTKGDARVVAGAGMRWDALVEETVSQGFWGLENLSYVPGSVGATPVQNVGCYGVSVSDRIDWVEVYDRRDEALHILSPSACAFGYRDSIFKHAEGMSYIVTRVAYRMRTHHAPVIEYKDLAERFANKAPQSPLEVREALREIRGRKFPDLASVGTAGSFFKNPVVSRSSIQVIEQWLKQPVPQYPVDDVRVKIPLAWLLETLGWKGKRVGSVGTWDAHALVLVHYGGGTANDLLALARDIEDDVKRRTAIHIEPEVCIARPPAGFDTVS